MIAGPRTGAQLPADSILIPTFSYSREGKGSAPSPWQLTPITPTDEILSLLASWKTLPLVGPTPARNTFASRAAPHLVRQRIRADFVRRPCRGSAL